MANRSVKVVLQAQVDQYVRTMKSAAQSTEQLEKAAKGTNAATAKQAKALKTLAPALLAIGTATVAGLGASAKAAIDWESSWTGVMKTVEGTPAQLAEIEDGLRGLTRELPASHAEIAEVAQAAGQLGVATPDVVDFTKVMIDMGESTNLTAEEAATTLARFANVMGTSTDEMNNLGAAIVGLGNNSATTEKEIAELAMRLSGAGAQLGLTEGDVLGMSAAMSSVGINAEAGGSAMSISMKRIGTAVDEGGETLDKFASTSGMTSEEFSQAWEEDAAGALTTFIGGLGAAGEEGESVNGILTELGITGLREADVMLRLSSSGDLLAESIARGNDEFSKGTALQEEAAKRYATTESQIAIAWNTIKDAAIDAGAVILPVVAGLAEGVASLVDWFTDLPGPVQGTVGALAGIAGVGAGALGLFVTMAPRIRETRDALRTLIPAGGRARGVLAGLGKAAASVAIVSTVAPMLNDLIPKQLPPDVETLTDALLGLSDSAGGLEDLDSIFEDTRGFMSNTGIDDLGEALQVIGNPTLGQNIGNVLTNVVSFGQMDTGALQFAREQFEGLDGALANMVQSGASEEAATAYEEIAAKAEEMGVPTEKMVEIFPEYSRLLSENATQSKLAAEGSEELDAALEEVGVSADGVVESMDTFLEQLFQAGILTMSSRDAAASYQASLDGVDDAVKTIIESNGEMGSTLNKSKTDFDLTTEAGRLANETFQGLARGGMDEVKALAEEGVGQDVLQEKLGNTYQDLIATGEQFGLTSGDARDLAREILGVPDGVTIDSWMDETAKTTAEQTKAAVDNLDGSTATVYTNHVENITTNYKTTRTYSVLSGASGSASLNAPSALGRRLPNRAAGGRLPYTGLGTDQILGIGSDGTPTAMVDDGEWVIREENARKYNRELEMINAGTFPKLANGGIPAGGGMSLAAPAAPAVNMPSQLVVQLGPGGPKMIADVVNEQVHSATRGERTLY